MVLCLIAWLVPAGAYAGTFEVSTSCSGSVTGRSSGNASNWLNGVQVGGSYAIPTDATSITLLSRITKKSSPASASAQITGCTMTYTFTWHPADGDTLASDPPPATAIVKEDIAYSAGYWVATDGTGAVSGAVSLTASGSVSGATSNAVDNPVSVSHNGNTSGDCATVSWGSGNAHSPSWQIATPVPEDGVITVTVPITAQTSASLSGDYCYSTDSASMSVTPTVIVRPLLLFLAGSRGDRSPDDLRIRDILIGQGCVTYLVATGYTISGQVWTIPSDAFKSYEAHSSDSGGFARVTYFDPEDMSAPTVHFYCRDGGSDFPTSSTVSAEATVWDGATRIGDVCAQATLQAWAPWYSCVNSLRDVHEIDNPGGDGLMPGLWAIAATTMPTVTYDEDSSEWTGEAGPPWEFLDTRGSGQWSWVQLMCHDDWMRQGILDENLGTVDFYWRPWSTNGILGLDTRYPYAPYTGYPDYDNMHQDDPNAGWSDGGSEHENGDSPGSYLAEDWTSLSKDETFQTYMMYRPPDAGYGRMWVPLNIDVWNSAPYVYRPDTDWGTPWALAGPPWPDLGPVTCSLNARYTTHPEWEQVLIAQDGWAW